MRHHLGRCAFYTHQAVVGVAQQHGGRVTGGHMRVEIGDVLAAGDDQNLFALLGHGHAGQAGSRNRQRRTGGTLE